MMRNMTLWTALITPFNDDGEIQFSELEKLLHRQNEAGNGILLIGSTGEGLALSEHEKRMLIKFAREQQLDVPVMAGVGGFRLKDQLAWIDYCNGQEIDAFLPVAPLYAKPGEKGVEEWFRAILNAADKPCMIYNIPSRTGVKITPSVLERLSGHQNFWAVKEASGSIADYQEFRQQLPDLPLFSGDDALLPYFAAIGSSGLVSVASNVWPKAVKKYTELCLSRKTDGLFPVWKLAAEALFSAPNPIPVKVLLQKKGLIESAALRAPLTSDELESSDHLLKADQDINQWYKTLNLKS
jgi:4-hydroxy-tetrahydrodipicolinate synthase